MLPMFACLLSLLLLTLLHACVKHLFMLYKEVVF